MWWKTTETHRAPLPSSEISSLENIPITFTMEVAIFAHDDKRHHSLSEELQAYFQGNDVFDAKLIPIKINREEVSKVKTPAMLEKQLLKINEIRAGNLLIAEWKGLEDEVLVTSERTIFISEKASADKIYQVIRSWVVRDYKIRSILGRVKTFDGKQLRHNFPPPSPEYEVLVSVLNPRPDLQTLHWNVKKAIETYLQPFLVEFKDLSIFTLKSQWKYQLELKYESKQIQDETKVGRHFAMEKESLPQIVTSIERKLGTDVANKPCIHLVIYAPPCKMAPVYVYQGMKFKLDVYLILCSLNYLGGKRVSNFTFDSFISAKWGGILLANPSDAVCSAASNHDSIQEIYLNSHEIMDFVLYELRKILELEIEVPLNYAAVESLVQIAPRLWERDMFLRNGAIHLIASASSTLQSLIKLLDDIKNIVIGDHVGAEIRKAYENVVQAKEFLAANEIQESVKHALLAYIAAEKAFNDPSLLELLYFPEEQKYAVYIPLFLPIFIPVIFSLNSIKKYFKKDEQKENKEVVKEDVVVKEKDE
jgi:GPI-anchor transamidase subunit S